MRALEPLELGLMFWAKEDARETLREVKSFGVSAGQLGFPGEMNLAGKADEWSAALAAEDFPAVTAVLSYAGEDYADIPTVQRTVGLVPEATRAERVARTKQVANIANELDIKSVACHIGFVPHDRGQPSYAQIRDIARELCDHCARHGQSFTLETGQEPADILLRFLADVDRPNLRINFDPANMILYGSGDPIEALRKLGPHVISVHCKDGDWPSKNDAGALGKERALGAGSVDFPRFIAALKEIGYTGILSLEREETDQVQRAADIRAGLKLLKRILDRE
ncbi:MAG: sugar phosphate isomerase/epimerase [Bryobacteraceae bacterium]